MNALLIYVLVSCNIIPIILQGLYWRHPKNNIVSNTFIYIYIEIQLDHPIHLDGVFGWQVSMMGIGHK